MNVKNKAVITLNSIAIILSTLAFYWQNLTIILNEALNNELATHILLIPPLFLYLIYRKRKVLRTAIAHKDDRNILASEIYGVLLCTLAILIYWHSAYTFNPLEYQLLSLPIFIAGTILILFNTETLKQLIFPLAFLAFLIPPPTEIAYKAGTYLAAISTEASYTILKTMRVPVTLSNRYWSPIITLQAPSGPIPFAIDIACSGIYSLIGFTVFAIFTAYIFRGATWKKLAILILGFPLIYALNILRITTIVLIGYWKGTDIALNLFHLLGGWTLIFLGTLALLLIAEKVFKIKTSNARKDGESCPQCRKYSNFCLFCGRLLKPKDIKLNKRNLAKIFLLTLMIIQLTLIQVPVFALTEGPATILNRTPTGNQATAQILPEIDGYNLSFLYRDTKFENISKQDASLIYKYTPQNGSKPTFWVGLEVGPTKGLLHPWEVCLVTWPRTHGEQPSVKTVDLRDVRLLENPPVVGRFFAFHPLNSNRTTVILYWYENSVFQTKSGFQNKYVKISLLTYIEKPDRYVKAEETLLPIGISIVKHWQTLKTWSWVTLAIAQNGSTLIILNTILLSTVALYQTMTRKKEEKAKLKLIEKIREKEDRFILKAVQKASEEGEATGEGIASNYKKLTGRTIEAEKLIEKLKEAEKAGLIERKIKNKNDKPVLTWKTVFPSKKITPKIEHSNKRS